MHRLLRHATPRSLAQQRRTITVLRTADDVRAWRSKASGTVGLVPTMGALHEGHAALAQRAAAENDCSIASVFVNPTQFAPTDDLDQYPRALERDLETLEEAGVDACFAPRTPDELYAEGVDGGFRVIPPADVETRAEASARPGHFAGVCTVVAKLWNLARPDRSYFGQKDALQCAVLRRLHADLCFPGEMIVCDTQRADDGLALSSRNAYLSEAERRAAPVVYAALARAEAAWRGGEAAASRIAAAAREALAAEPLVSSVDYVSVADYASMEELEEVPAPGSVDVAAVISVAARVGGVRLIDNLPLR